MNKAEILDKARARDVMIAIFTLVLAGGESSRKEASERIRELTPKERRDLRAACQNLDNMIDDVWMEEMREKRRGKLS